MFGRYACVALSFLYSQGSYRVVLTTFVTSNDEPSCLLEAQGLASSAIAELYERKPWASPCAIACCRTPLVSLTKPSHLDSKCSLYPGKTLRFSWTVNLRCQCDVKPVWDSGIRIDFVSLEGDSALEASVYFWVPSGVLGMIEAGSVTSAPPCFPESAGKWCISPFPLHGDEVVLACPYHLLCGYFYHSDHSLCVGLSSESGSFRSCSLADCEYCATASEFFKSGAQTVQVQLKRGPAMTAFPNHGRIFGPLLPPICVLNLAIIRDIRS